MLISNQASTQTDENGDASLEKFSLNEDILFKHSSFLNYTTTREKIEKQGKIVLLIENPIKLDEVVVSANRWEESKSEIPHLIETIDPEVVVNYSPQTTA